MEEKGLSNYFSVPVPETGVLLQDVSMAWTSLPEIDENHYASV